MKYFWTSSPYDECESGARMSSEEESGRPPPRISSRDGIPVDVIVVRGEAGEGRVPGS